MTDDEQGILDDFHGMDSARQQQMRIVMRALRIEFPRRDAPRLTLVDPLVNVDFRESLQNRR